MTLHYLLNTSSTMSLNYSKKTIYDNVYMNTGILQYGESPGRKYLVSIIDKMIMSVQLLVSLVVAELLSCKSDFHISFGQLLLLLQTLLLLNSQHPEMTESREH